MELMERFMLASVDTKNNILYNYGTYSSYGLSGIALVELIRLGKLGYEEGLVTVRDSSSTGDELLDEVLQVIALKDKPKKIENWVAYMPYKIKRFSKRVMERLEDNGILRIERGRILLLIPSTKYIVTNENERNRIVNSLRDTLLRGDRSPKYETLLLISIVAACGSLQKLFSKEELKDLKENLKQLRKGTYFEAGKDDLAMKVALAVQKAITAVQAATVAAGS